MRDFPTLLALMKDRITDLAREYCSDYQYSARKDGEDFLEQSRADLERWTKQVAAGTLSPEEFEALVLARKETMEMVILRRIGLGPEQLDRYQQAVLQTVVSTTLEVNGLT
ncbi:MAG: hypothetical protein C4524_08565 [Candidatus Zixiibacteriota bacterium]|nr:MAG: hypothetical protein C4524_08565 [candidate division Zixibacteria bacterium]